MLELLSNNQTKSEHETQLMTKKKYKRTEGPSNISYIKQVNIEKGDFKKKKLKKELLINRIRLYVLHLIWERDEIQKP